MNVEKAEEYERTLIVSHLSDDFDEDKVRHIFKRGKHGGEEIEKVTLLSRDKGMILLKNTDAIDRILNKEKETKDKCLKVERVSAQDLDELQKKLNMSRKVLISGFHKEIKINTVYIYCQKKRNDGGKVEQVNLEGGKAFVVFEDVQVAQKFANKKRQFQGKQLQVNLIIDEKPGCVVKVEGLPDGVTEYTIAIHFQKKRNGGGEIEEVRLGPAKNEATVIFKENGVAASAASQSHKMEGKTLTVKLYDIKFDELNKIMNRNRRMMTAEIC
ncbi:interferon-induced 35 kDa protein homolog [Xenia sp. Carnegie-2017]|uniref:interferon-induced 35 kDa protein homolog n=1 Tax=Xenia sp. Carnegie-2017 TaxID=2897299 RepID=UPI001F03C83C|nr:interferon-induced 35 kDa protein homolog [Xenia sp. Carnegie-2017]